MALKRIFRTPNTKTEVMEKLNRRLREISGDPRFTNEDRERIAEKIKKLKKGKTKKGIGPAGGAPVSKKTGKVFTGYKGTKRSVGPAGAPVSKRTGKVFTKKRKK
jgi:hypothetical protein